MLVRNWTNRAFVKMARHSLLFSSIILVAISLTISGLLNFSTKAHADFTPEWTQAGFTKVATNASSSCGISVSHHLWCWGGDITNYTVQSPLVGPRQVDATGILAGKTITDISMSSSHYCVVASGVPYCWGPGVDGQLGNGTTTNSLTPVAVDTTGVLNGKTITAISAGSHVTCVVASGAAYCWGSGGNGRLGQSGYYDTAHNSSVPIAVDTSGALNGKTVTDISVGAYTTCAVAGGAAYCWGDNTTKQLGSNVSTTFNGNQIGSPVPIAVDTSGALSGKTVTAISNGDYATCVVASQNVYCWGSNSFGLLGDGTNNDSYTAVQAGSSGDMSGKIAHSVSVSSYNVCAETGGDAYCWGVSGLGDLNSPLSSNIPVAVDKTHDINNKQVQMISTSGTHACVTTFDNGNGWEAFCWGDNTGGAIGSFRYRDSNNVSSPRLVVDDRPIIATVNGSVEPDGQPHNTMLQGLNLSMDMTLTVDGSPATIISVDAPNGTNLQTMVFEVPASTTEKSVDLILANSRGEIVDGLASIIYQFTTPAVDTMSPRSTLVNTTKSVTFTGNNFYPSTAVTVDGVAATVTSATKTKIVATFPALSTSGEKSVVLINAGDREGSSYSFYYVNHLSVTSVSPNTLTANGQSASVVLSGDGFSPDTTATVDGVPASVSLIDEHSLSVTVPGSSANMSSTIVVDNDNGDIVTLTNAIQYVPPQITSVDYSIDQGKKILNIHGNGLPTGSSLEGLSGYLATLNGSNIPFCTTDVYTSTLLQGIGYDPQYFSDSAPCYVYLADSTSSNGPIITSPNLFVMHLPDNFDESSPLTVQLVGTQVFHYNPGAASPHYITNVNTGLAVTNDTNDNLTTDGTTDPQSSVTLSSTTVPIATIPVDTSRDRNWSSVIAGSDEVAHKAFAHGITSAPGSLSGTFSLYVPKAASDNAVVICPGAASLAAVTTTCAGSHTYDLSDMGVTVVTVGGKSYWLVSGLTGTGGVSIVAASTSPVNTGSTAAPATLVSTGLALGTITTIAVGLVTGAVLVVWSGRKRVITNF